ncbi:hypothetical protein [Chakrabartyella piscis]|uniref:hypothetical protein n=1 Tax=Chakrabartyella piscis TaxID=2918914 RepID=UPI002958DAC2|nr:hypothetical protein [Chakrabartyella piscis]
MELPKRKLPRLKEYDYSSNGAYFLTICTQKKQKILWEDGYHVPLCKIEDMYE